MGPEAPIGSVRARAYTIPTDAPEADGTIAWDSTTLIVVEVTGGGMTGLGYTYNDKSTAALINGKLEEVVAGKDAMDPLGLNAAMHRAVRNIGRDGVAATAISGVDAAIWDLKAKLLGLPLVRLLGAYRMDVPIYGSGGFTSYDDAQLTRSASGLGGGGWLPLGEDEGGVGSRGRPAPGRGREGGDR